MKLSKYYQHKETRDIVKVIGKTVYEWDPRFDRWEAAYYVMPDASNEEFLEVFEEVTMDKLVELVIRYKGEVEEMAKILEDLEED